MPNPTSTLGHALKLAFVGRRAELDAFENMLWPVSKPRYQVLSVSGVGGQGKTSLLNQFAQRLTALDCQDRPVCRLDFSVPQHRTMVEGLFFLRNQLRTQGVPTHAFDVAFARHFSLIRPGRDIKAEYPELYRFPEDSLFGELVDIGAEAVREIPGGKLAVTLLARLSNKVEQWYTKRGVAILAQLDAMHAQQLGTELPAFLGFDLLEFVSAYPRRLPVLMLDTYEALWRESSASTALASASGDLWVRRLAEECPGCLWVIAGRHRLKWAQHDPDWAQYIVERDIGALSPDEADALLDAGAISGESLRAALRTAAAGHPLSLALGIRFCQMKALDGASVTERDVPRTQQEVLDRFFDHLEPTVRGLIRVLAVPNLVRVELWPHLARQAFPVFDLYPSSTVLGEVFFRVVSEREYAMHERVREHLLDELARREPDLLRRARLAVFEFYDRAADGGDTDIPDLSGTVRRRDECLGEASQLLVEAAPQRYIRWCEQQLEAGKPGSKISKGSRQRRALVERADALVSTIDDGTLFDAATLARLRLCADPWDAPGLDLLDRLVAAIEGKVLPAEVIAPLRQIADDLMGANPSRLPMPLVQALLKAGVEHIGLALLVGDLERATRWAERDVRQDDTNSIGASWFGLQAIARSTRVDLCEAIGDRLARKRQHEGFWIQLARTVDALCFEQAPQLGLRFVQRALQVPDCSSLVQRLNALERSVITHQVVLTVYLALQGSAEADNAKNLIDQRFDHQARRAFVEGLEQLLASGGDVGVLGSDPGRRFVEAFEQEHGVHGFLEGYLEAAFDTDRAFAALFSAPALAAVRAELKRSYEIYRSLGGRPNVATLRKIRIELVVTERSELFFFLNDALVLFRPVDWLSFDADWRFRFGDVRQGQNRVFGGAQVARELDLGDGATLLLVLTDDAGQPLEGEYKRFYGRAW